MSTYEEKIIEIVQKAIKDEISSAAFYVKQAQEIGGYGEDDIAEQLLENGKEEYEHFTQLFDFASKFGFIDKIMLDFDKLDQQYYAKNAKDIMVNIEDFETGAFNDYKSAASLALSEGDLETHEFFKELMNDEAKHLDEFLKFQNKSRTINSGSSLRLKDLIK